MTRTRTGTYPHRSRSVGDTCHRPRRPSALSCSIVTAQSSRSVATNPMPAPILVIGATGNVGRGVVGSLIARQVAVRAAVRTLSGTQRPGIDEVLFDVQSPATFAPALAGCHGLFLLRPPAISQVASTLVPLIDEAERQGLEQTVFPSVAGADKNPLIPHHAVEKRLQAGSMAWTFLRAGFFAQNLCDAYRQDIQAGEIWLPAGAGRAAFVDAQDLGEVAAKALNEGVLQREAPQLTGPQALSFFDVAQMLTEELGRPIRYRPVGPLRYAHHVMKQGLPLAQAAVQTVLHMGLRLGQAEAVDPRLGQIFGRPAHTLRDVIRRNLQRWAAVP
ncbi:MAG: NmrA family NAD(P)-binding protein [Rubrivivax sp.]|nr:NmrA family NAD(P)-binding protein [Rubrivivax sp.]